MLTPKRRAFVKAYMGEARGNATAAARLAGYASPTEEGCRLLRNAQVRAELDALPERPDIATPSEVQAAVTAVLRDPDARTVDRLRAAEILAKMLPGLTAPARHEISGPEGAPLQTQEIEPAPDLSLLTVDELHALHDLLAKASPDEGQPHRLAVTAAARA